MNTLIGMGAAVVAFFATAIFVDQLVARGFLETCVPGAIAAYFAYQHFANKGKELPQKILNPAAETWPMAFLVAWGCIKDVFGGTGVQMGAGGSTAWEIQKEDQARGVISGQLAFTEHVGGPVTGQVVPRTITCNVELTPNGSSTKVAISYQVTSPMGDSTAQMVIQKTQAAFQNAMNGKKGLS